MALIPLFADVLLPLSLEKRYTFRVSDRDRDRIGLGYRVVVQFGAKRYYTAIVVNLHGNAPLQYEAKEIVTVQDPYPMVLQGQLQFWKWVADYYLCTEGEVFKAAVPSGLKLESETIVVCNEEFEATEPFSATEQLIWQILLQDRELSILELDKKMEGQSAVVSIQKLLQKGAIGLKEELKRGYKPKMETFVTLAPPYCEDRESIRPLFDQLARAPKQMQVLMAYIELSAFWNPQSDKQVTKRQLVTRSMQSASIVQALVDRGILIYYEQEVGRIHTVPTHRQPLPVLSAVQQRAYDQIVESLDSKQVTLLHGVTSSGKTELYIHLIQQVVDSGKQVLFLLPEIALTKQITDRLYKVFGTQMGVYHSKFSDNERVEVWKSLLSESPYSIVLGVRSSIFLPFSNLGLIIIDEEHESSYKQQDPSPRYHARNAAIWLAHTFGAKTLLGTATPSLESYYNAQQGKYGYVALTERYRELALPSVEVVNTKELYRKKRMDGPLSPDMIAHIKRALEHKEQVILFQNRRGFAPMVACRVCAWVPRCQHCDVSLTYHKHRNVLTCHYCGYQEAVPKICPACGSIHLEDKGFGTERIEDDIKRLFPQAKVARMDLDTTRTRKAYEAIISGFESYETDILIGTQMITKGLDFDAVSLVGILNADMLLNFPDFRAHERSFQMLSQVAGRAGRKNKQGVVVLQTAQPEHPIIRDVMENDYLSMYSKEMSQRLGFSYPPYFRLINLYLKHRDYEVVNRAAQQTAAMLREQFDHRVLGPDNPAVPRIQNLYIKKVMIKFEAQWSPIRIKEYLRTVVIDIQSQPQYRSLIIYYDVDPL